MGYYDSQEEYDKRGIDYDLCACLDYTSIPFTVDEIEKVLAVWEGENAADDWRWVLQLKDERYVFLQGGCDFTGWDCRSWATSAFAESPEEAAKFALGNVDVSKSTPYDAGLGHTIKMVFGDYNENFKTVYEDLLSQLEKGKTQTWTEQKNEEFGVVVTSRNIEQESKDIISEFLLWMYLNHKNDFKYLVDISEADFRVLMLKYLREWK